MPVEQLNILLARANAATVRASSAAKYTDEIFKLLTSKKIAQEPHINFHLRALEAAKKAELMLSNAEKAVSVAKEGKKCNELIFELIEIASLEKTIAAIEVEASVAEAARNSIMCEGTSNSPSTTKKNRCLIS